MEVVNTNLVHLSMGYNQKYPKIWDENMIYIQHSYNISIHIYTGNSPFETCFGYFPPSPLDDLYGKQGGTMEGLIGDSLKEEKIM